MEAQIEEEERAFEADRKQKSLLSAEAQQKMESLRLSRARIEEQLARAVYPAHREVLMKALSSIEKEVEDINRESPNSKK
ncbi:MAG: hypothetical protein ABJB61_12890 [bacterium]